MRGDVEMRDAAPVESEYNEAVQDAERCGGYDEEIDGDERSDMVVQERSPCLRRRFSTLGQVSRHSPLRDIDPELQKFTVDSRRSPRLDSRSPSGG
jgi:hypothetical protein